MYYSVICKCRLLLMPTMYSYTVTCCLKKKVYDGCFSVYIFLILKTTKGKLSDRFITAVWNQKLFFFFFLLCGAQHTIAVQKLATLNESLVPSIITSRVLVSVHVGHDVRWAIVRRVCQRGKRIYQSTYGSRRLLPRMRHMYREHKQCELSFVHPKFSYFHYFITYGTSFWGNSRH